ncbi:dnaJ homolog subfamily C member 4-like [Antedon mediterranea]|uniref:dnaJ homolog subfamily C member 4-like n=1 Tax=Antedon mediterranea TaxID=105859 RepID=UPI003AF99AA3
MEGLTVMCARCVKYYNYYTMCSRTFSVSSLYLGSSSLYDILNVTKTASTKEIKDAYFSLSKELHPDRNPSDPKKHRRFVELNDAYSILSKPLTRRQYDERFTTMYRQQRNNGSTGSSAYNSQYSNHYNWYQEVDYSKYSEERDASRNYYGIRGISRLSNNAILYGVLIYLAFGVFFHFVIYQQSSEYAQQQMNEKDKKIAALYNTAKEKALKNGNKRQMQLIRKKHEDSQAKRLQYIKDDD